MQWQLKKFDELLPVELYRILQLRQEVFVVEQNCPYIDADENDLQSYHLMGIIFSDSAESEYRKKKLIAYSRIVLAGVSYPEVSIGRVVTHPEYRKKGTGIILMEESLRQIQKIFGKVPIRIGAQYYLVDFYKKFGFEPIGDIYLEDGIKHIIMLRVK
ncbi:MAG: GNAT family N-acetyltransferase [Bacteroidia bacterium]